MRIDIRAFKYLLKGEFWVRLWREVNQDDCWGMAAQLSYFYLLAFFPFLIFLSALVGFVPFVADLIDQLIVGLFNFIPEKSHDLVSATVHRLIDSRDEGILTFGIGLSLWFASFAFSAMASLLNQAYQVQETRSLLKIRALSIFLTVIVSIFLVLSGVLLFFGDWIIGLVVEPGPLKVLYGLARWLLILLLMNFGVQIVYYALPAHRFPAKLISPGGVVAILGWVFGSLMFRHYVNLFFSNLQELYGGLGALIALMIWFYICSLFLLLGGEIDSEIYKMRHEEGKKTR
jgi:membrane protein